MDNISLKSLRLLQNIYSLKELNKKILPLNQEYDPKDEYGYFATEDYYPIIYEESVSLLVEIAVLMRREAEYLKKLGSNLHTKIKYINVAKDTQTNQDISFVDALSKIVHSEDILLQVKDTAGTIGYGYETDRNCSFTGVALSKGTDKNNNPQTIIIDITKFCVNVFMYKAEKYEMQ